MWNSEQTVEIQVEIKIQVLLKIIYKIGNEILCVPADSKPTLIWWSPKKKTTGESSSPAFRIIFIRSSFQSATT